MSGYFRATAQHDGANNVSLRLVPELHLGPIQRTFQTVPSAAAIGPQEFKINNGQEEDTIRELATSLTLEPGQLAVIGCRPEQKRRPRDFLLHAARGPQRPAPGKADPDLGVAQPARSGTRRAARARRAIGPHSCSAWPERRDRHLRRRATRAPVEPPTAGVDTMLVDPAALTPAPAATPPSAKPRPTSDKHAGSRPNEAISLNNTVRRVSALFEDRSSLQ